jgi:hypothetical protein
MPQLSKQPSTLYIEGGRRKVHWKVHQEKAGHKMSVLVSRQASVAAKKLKSPASRKVHFQQLL